MIVSSSNYSNFVPIVKPNGKLRLCIDMIALNKHIKSIASIVRMGSPNRLLHRIIGKKFMWSLDLQNAYFHITVSPLCAQYYGVYSHTTFQDEIGFDRLIQGEKNAVFSYNDMTNQTFGSKHEFLMFWVDDGLIYENNGLMMR